LKNEMNELMSMAFHYILENKWWCLHRNYRYYFILVSNNCTEICNFDQYIAGMKQVGSVAWNIVHYIQKQHASFTFGKRITNEHFHTEI
jgi:hypothetical protein